MIERITIRQETKDDFKEVFQLNRIAFGRENEAKLVDALRCNPTVFVPTLSIVATKKDQVVGYIVYQD